MTQDELDLIVHDFKTDHTLELFAVILHKHVSKSQNSNRVM